MKNEFTIPFEQNTVPLPHMESEFVCAWCCHKACKICISLVQNKDFKKVISNLTGCPNSNYQFLEI
jgi:hypothetical protein